MKIWFENLGIILYVILFIISAIIKFIPIIILFIILCIIGLIEYPIFTLSLGIYDFKYTQKFSKLLHNGKYRNIL